MKLDARQRAMLQEMGVWWPAAPQLPLSAGEVAQARRPPAAAQVEKAPPLAEHCTPLAPIIRTPDAKLPTPRACPGALPWQLGVEQALYPEALEPALEAGGWLIVQELPRHAQTQADAPARLLDSMLRALGLHRHPRVLCAALHRQEAGGGGVAAASLLREAFEAMLTRLRPDCVLLLVSTPPLARAMLPCAPDAPLGSLRAQSWQVAGATVVPSHAPGYLLRAEAAARASAWADLCRAHAACSLSAQARQA